MSLDRVEGVEGDEPLEEEVAGALGAGVYEELAGVGAAGTRPAV